jgi:hypothetical protein
VDERLPERMSGQENTMLGRWVGCKHFCFFICTESVQFELGHWTP